MDRQSADDESDGGLNDMGNEFLKALTDDEILSAIYWAHIVFLIPWILSGHLEALEEGQR